MQEDENYDSTDPASDLSDIAIINIWKETGYDYIKGNIPWMKRVIMTVRRAIEEDRKTRS